MKCARFTHQPRPRWISRSPRISSGCCSRPVDATPPRSAAWREIGDLVDPHTAVALAVADRDTSDSRIPNIVLSTAHPAKFPDAVEAACGVRPELPAWLEGLMSKPEHIKVMKNDQVEVERFVLSVSRAAKQGVAG